MATGRPFPRPIAHQIKTATSPGCESSAILFVIFIRQTAALKIGEAIYGNKGAAGGDAAGEGEGAGAGADGADKENVQDAEFEEKTPDGEEKEKKSQ